MKLPLKLTFQKKLVILFLLFSVIPLIFAAIVTSAIVNSNYKNTLKQLYSMSADLQQEILLNFLQSQTSWVDGLTSNKLLISELDMYVDAQSVTNSARLTSTTAITDSKVKQDLSVFLTSVKMENPYITNAYFIDPAGRVLLSTAKYKDQNEIKKIFSRNVNFRKAYIYAPYKSSSGTRLIPISVDFVDPTDNSLIGVLVVDFDESIIQSVLTGNFYIKSEGLQEQYNNINTYIVDNGGYLISTLNFNVLPKTPVMDYPIQVCQKSQDNASGFWKDYNGQQVYGVSRCLSYGDLHWTLVSDQSSADAFSVSDQLADSILIIAPIIGIFLIIVFIYISKSLSNPIILLRKYLEEVGKGNYDLKFELHTNDELEDLGTSFNNMSQLLRQRDSDFKSVNIQREGEKERITNERNMLSVILSGITEGVIAIDQYKNILLFNKAVETLTGLSLQSAVGKHIDEVLEFYDKKERITSRLYIGQPVKIAARFEENGLQVSNYQGKKITVSLASIPVSLVDQSTGWIITFHDISSEVEGDELKIDFVSMAAHELRTPLTSVRGYASLLKMEKEKDMDDRGKEMLQRLIISSDILGNLVENLLNVTRIEQNRLTITSKLVDLTPTIIDAVTNLQQEAKIKNQKLDLQLNGTLPIVSADSFRITQVITNLVANALHYTSEGGSITVVAEEKNNFLQISISDTGEGIPEDALPKLFTKFFRVSGNVGDGSKGTGLGLFISKSIIDMHKGKIWVTSESGKGSIFTFILPKADQISSKS
jgi:PAS domain S-box-containing protein